MTLSTLHVDLPVAYTVAHRQFQLLIIVCLLYQQVNKASVTPTTKSA